MSWALTCVAGDSPLGSKILTDSSSRTCRILIRKNCYICIICHCCVTCLLVVLCFIVRARFRETLWISPPGSAAAEVACLRSGTFGAAWCVSSDDSGSARARRWGWGWSCAVPGFMRVCLPSFPEPCSPENLLRTQLFFTVQGLSRVFWRSRLRSLQRPLPCPAPILHHTVK